MQEVTDATLEQFVADTKGVLLVDIWAEWCPPCKAFTPVLEELDKQLDDTSFASLDADTNPVTMSKYGVMSIPTSLVFVDGKRVDTWVGFIAKDALKAKLDKLTG